MATAGGFFRPITKRGQFFHDDFFQDFHKHYDSAIHDVMNRWSGRSLLADQFSSYKKLRENRPVEENIAASISDTKDSYVIVLDMTDFVNGDITVQTIGSSSVVKANAGSLTFNRKYPLPLNTNLQGVSAAMSNEGILTITAPKQGRKQSTGGRNISISGDGGASSDTKSNYVSVVKIDVGEPEKQGDSSKECSGVTNTTSEGNSSGKRVIPLIVEGDSNSTSTTTISGGSGSQSTQTTTSGASESTTANDRTLSIAKRGGFFQDPYFENVWKDFETAVEEMADRKSAETAENQSELQKKEEARQEVQNLINQRLKELDLEKQKKEAEKRKQKDSQQQQHLLVGPPNFNRMNSYRNLRDWAFQDDTQAAKFSQDETHYKIVVDVHDFVDGKLDVQAMDGAVVITGEHGSLSFHRRFSLPGLSKPDDVTADISTDGVLTVTAPK